MTQASLAKKIGIDESHLNRIIKGQVPRLDTACRIATALDYPIDKVFICAIFNEESVRDFEQPKKVQNGD
jgi:transcriptional regulator with XRE-family HTH domain